MTFRDGSLRGALRRLDPPTRALLDLSFRHRWPPEEIAGALDLDVATVLELRDAALARVAAQIGLTDDPERAQALLARTEVTRNGSRAARRPRWWIAAAAAAVALAVALPLALSGGTKRHASPPPGRAVEPVSAAPAAPPPSPVLELRRLPAAYVGAAATARLVGGSRLDLSIRGLPRARRRDFAVWLIASPVRHSVLAHFAGGHAQLVIALPPGFRGARWIAVMRVGRRHLPHHKRVLQLSVSRL